MLSIEGYKITIGHSVHDNCTSILVYTNLRFESDRYSFLKVVLIFTIDKPVHVQKYGIILLLMAIKYAVRIKTKYLNLLKCKLKLDWNVHCDKV